MNLTVSGAYHSDNNLVRIRSKELAKDYLGESTEGDSVMQNYFYC